MHHEIEIRESLPGDRRALEELYPRAFPDEDLLPVVRDLLDEESGVLSLVAVREGVVVGHIAFSLCGIDGGEESVRDTVSMLGPLAVSPSFQLQGIGGALVREGLKRMKDEGVKSVYVLGNRAYYGRFGFATETKVLPAYGLPEEWRRAWQSLKLGGEVPDLAGTLIVPKPWARPELWRP